MDAKTHVMIQELTVYNLHVIADRAGKWWCAAADGEWELVADSWDSAVIDSYNSVLPHYDGTEGE